MDWNQQSHVVDAEAGVRRPNILMWLSEVTDEIIGGEWGERKVVSDVDSVKPRCNFLASAHAKSNCFGNALLSLGVIDANFVGWDEDWPVGGLPPFSAPPYSTGLSHKSGTSH